ncbi:MAG: DNA primase, partial [Verrucomicrobiota bacterium]
QTFHCFGCGAGGDAIKFLQLYENLPFPEAAKQLAGRVGVQIQEEALDPKEQALIRGRAEIKRMQSSAADWFHRLLFKSPSAQPARDYLRSRGLTMEVSRNWKFGFAPEDQRSFFDWANAEGFTVEQLVNGGLAKWRDEGRPDRGAYSFFRHRLMFPVNDGMGEPIAFSGRVLSKDQRGGKYVNSPETILFNKSKTFFGLDKSKRPIIQKKRAIILEGQLDLIAAYEGGIDNVVAPLGTAFTNDHARALKRLTDEVVLCFDSDTAGLNAASKAFRLLAPAGMMVRLALLPEGEDPDSLIRKEGVSSLEAILEEAPEFFDFQIDRRGDGLTHGPLRDRLNFAKDLSADVALVEDKMLQDSLISRITIKLGVGEDEIRKLVRNAARSQDRINRSRQKREAILRRRAEENGSTQAGDTLQAPDSSPNGEATGSDETTLSLANRSIRLLCKALLTDRETREAIIAEPIPPFLDDLSETEFLVRIWQGNFDPASSSSVNAFVRSLSEPEHELASQLLLEKSESITPDLAGKCLEALQRQSLQNRFNTVKARLADPNLSADSLVGLNKQLLDLRRQLNER